MTRRPRIQPEESKMNPAENKQPETKPEPETPMVADDLIGAIGAAQLSGSAAQYERWRWRCRFSGAEGGA